MADGTEKVPRAVSGPSYPESFTEGNGANAPRQAPQAVFPGAPRLSGPMPVPTRRDRWKLWNWRVRTKLFAVLLVPAVAAGVLGTIQVSSELRGVEDLGRTERQVVLGAQTASLVHEVQYERALMSGFVAANKQGDRTNLDLQKAREASQLVRKLSGYDLEPWKAVVGENLFVRESGAVASQFHDPPSIEPYSAELVAAVRPPTLLPLRPSAAFPPGVGALCLFPPRDAL